MFKKFYTFFLCLSLILLTSVGCSTVKGVFGKKSTATQKQSQKIDKVGDLISKNTEEKINQIASLSWGVQYSLDKISNSIIEVNVAKDLNFRVLTLSGNPSLDEIKRMQKIVDDLTSDLEKEKLRGKKELEKKDKEISQLQNTATNLLSLKDKEIDKYIELAKTTALQADATKAELDKMDKWFGLGAIFYGTKRFIFSSFILIGSLCIIYLLLRAFSATNPIVASIFSVFEIGVSWFVRFLRGLAPKSVSFANLVPKEKFDGYKNTLDLVIDGIQYLKQKQKDTGKEYTLNEVLEELDKGLNTDDKARIEECKKELKW